MREWTEEEIRKEEARRAGLVRQGKCPDSGLELVLDHPLGDAPAGRYCCEMCDCFGYLPREVDQ